MTKAIKISAIVVSILIALGVAISVILLTTSGRPALILKIQELGLHLGQEYELDEIVTGKGYKIEVSKPEILSINENSIKGVSCGETQVTFSTESMQAVLDVKVYATDMNFSESTLTMYINGNNRAPLSIELDNGKIANGITYTYDEDIISYDGKEVIAKKEGRTKIIAQTMGINGLLYAECEVEVKRYGYIESVNCDTIRMVEGQTKDIELVKYGSGEQVQVSYSTSDNGIEYNGQALKANSVGEYTIEIQGEVSYNEVKTFSVQVIVEPKLQIESIAIYKDNELVNELKVNTKADGTLDTYCMYITYSKEYVDNINVSGIQVLKIESEDNIQKVYFTKSTLGEIKIVAIDPIDNNKAEKIVDIQESEYIQKINYTLTNQNENTNTLYLYNTEYKTQAEQDGIYKSAILTLQDNVEVVIDDKVEYIDSIVTAKQEGISTIELKALDGSGVVERIEIDIQEVKVQEMSITMPSEIELNSTFSIEVAISPIYAINDIVVTYDEAYLTKDGERYQGIQAGETTIKIVDNKSGIVEERTLNIKAPVIETEEYTIDVKKYIEVAKDYDELKCEMNGEEVDITDYIYIMDFGSIQRLIAMQQGTIQIYFYLNGDIQYSIILNIV